MNRVLDKNKPLRLVQSGLSIVSLLDCSAAFIQAQNRFYRDGSEPLDEPCFVGRIVTAALVKTKDPFTFGAGQEHDLVTPGFFGKAACLIHTGTGKASAPEIGMGNNVFDESVRALTLCEVRQDHERAGGDDPAVFFRDQNGIPFREQDIVPNAFQPFIPLRNRWFVQMLSLIHI